MKGRKGRGRKGLWGGNVEGRGPTFSLVYATVAPPRFCNRGGSEVWVGGLEYEVPQKLTHLLQCIGNL